MVNFEILQIFARQVFAADMLQIVLFLVSVTIALLLLVALVKLFESNSGKEMN